MKCKLCKNKATAYLNTVPLCVVHYASEKEIKKNPMNRCTDCDELATTSFMHVPLCPKHFKKRYGFFCPSPNNPAEYYKIYQRIRKFFPEEVTKHDKSRFDKEYQREYQREYRKTDKSILYRRRYYRSKAGYPSEEAYNKLYARIISFLKEVGVASTRDISDAIEKSFAYTRRILQYLTLMGSVENITKATRGKTLIWRLKINSQQQTQISPTQ